MEVEGRGFPPTAPGAAEMARGLIPSTSFSETHHLSRGGEASQVVLSCDFLPTGGVRSAKDLRLPYCPCLGEPWSDMGSPRGAGNFQAADGDAQGTMWDQEPMLG